MPWRKDDEPDDAYRRRNAASMRAYRAYWKRKGWCAWCPAKAEPGHVLCAACAEKNAQASAARRAAIKGQAPPVPVTRKAKYYVERKPEGDEC